MACTEPPPGREAAGAADGERVAAPTSEANAPPAGAASGPREVSAQAPFLILPLKDYSGTAAAAAGRDVREDRQEAPFAELREAYPQHFLPREKVVFLTQGFLYDDYDACRPPVLSKLVPRLHHLRPESWKGVVFANLETGCFRQIRGDRDNDAEVAAAFDNTFAAWIGGIKEAWPRSLVFGYFLPGDSSWYMPDWPESGKPPEDWQALVSVQREAITALDGFAPEIYFPWNNLRGGDEVLEHTIEKYERAVRHIVTAFPDKVVAPVVWLMYYHGRMPGTPPCGEWRPVVTWDGKSGETACGYPGLAVEDGVRVLEMIQDAGAHGLFYWGERTDWGMWQAGDPRSTAFAAMRIFLERNSGSAAKAPGPATFLEIIDSLADASAAG